jgi:hypothetical protein
LGAKMEPVAQRIYDQQIAAAKATLSADAFQVAWDGGQRLTLDEARVLALEDTSS